MGTLSTQSEELANLVETAAPAVVRVEARRGGGASGVVWDPNGLVVTAAHVVERQEGLAVVVGEEDRREATVLGFDHATDLAVLRIRPDGVSPARLGNLDGLKVGHLVVGLARPGKTVRARLGMVGTLGGAWRTPAGTRVERYLEADSGIARGFSGGPLISTDGAVLGINTAGLLRGTMVTLPVATVSHVVAELAAHGKVRTAYLGVAMQPVPLRNPPDALKGHDLGMLITHVEAQSPAERAGILLGDVLVSLGSDDGDGVQSLEELKGVLSSDMVGKTVTARLMRAGAVMDVPVVLAARP